MTLIDPNPTPFEIISNTVALVRRLLFHYLHKRKLTKFARLVVKRFVGNTKCHQVNRQIFLKK